MRIHPGLFSAAHKLTGGAVAIGNFDGLHLGHRALFAAARAAAQRNAGPVAALTFEPHPAQVLAPQMAPQLLTSPVRKRELLAENGVTDLVVQRFDRSFAGTSPRQFVEALLALGVAEVVVGHDFTYGRDRGGDTESLRAALGAGGVRLHVVEKVCVEGLLVSSTKIRELALEGRVEAAARLLGRPLGVDGEVVRGAGRGRTLGWPTANLHTSAQLLPAIGVYAVRVRPLEDAALPSPDGPVFSPPRFGPPLKGAANLGLNPTFTTGSSPQKLSLEVHLLDFAQDLYGRTLRVEFVARLRDERRFPHVDALKAQIVADVAEARTLLAQA